MHCMKPYIAWCPGLDEDLDALQLVASSNVAGVETSGIDAMLRMQEAGVRVSLHNIVRSGVAMLGSEGFQEQFSDELLLAARSDAQTLGFHLPRRYSPERAGRVRSDIQFLNRLFPQKSIVAELQCVFSTGSPDAQKWHPGVTCDDELFHTRVHEVLVDASLLCDVSHLLVTASQFSSSVDACVAWCVAVLDSIDWRVEQLHVVVPSGPLEYVRDLHGVFDGSEWSEAVLLLCQKVLANSPVKTVTLEMYTGLSPREHVQVLIKQAELFRQRTEGF